MRDRIVIADLSGHTEVLRLVVRRNILALHDMGKMVRKDGGGGVVASVVTKTTS